MDTLSKDNLTNDLGSEVLNQSNSLSITRLFDEYTQQKQDFNTYSSYRFNENPFRCIFDIHTTVHEKQSIFDKTLI